MKLTFKQTAFAALASTALVLGIGSAFAPGFNSNLVMSRASGNEVVGGSIVFDKANTTKSGTTNTTHANSHNILCKTFNNSSGAQGFIGVMGETNSNLRFYEEDGSTEYMFEDISSIKVDKAWNAFEYTIYWTFVDGSTSSTSDSASGTSFTISAPTGKKVTSFYLVRTSGSASIKTITLTYNCTPKTETSLSIETAPTKTSYFEGEKFSKTGMVVKVNYSNDTSAVITNYIYSPSGTLSLSDNEIVISYHGLSVSQAITVNELTTEGTYRYVSGSNTYTLVLNEGGTGVYTFVNPNDSSQDCQQSFTWSKSGTAFSFTRVNGTGDFVGSVGNFCYLFTKNAGDNYNSNDSGTMSGAAIKICLCNNNFISATTAIRTLAKIS